MPTGTQLRNHERGMLQPPVCRPAGGMNSSLAEWGIPRAQPADGLRAAQGEAAVESLLETRWIKPIWPWLATCHSLLGSLTAPSCHEARRCGDSLQRQLTTVLLLSIAHNDGCQSPVPGRSVEQNSVWSSNGGLDSNLHALAGVRSITNPYGPAGDRRGCVNPGPNGRAQPYCLSIRIRSGLFPAGRRSARFCMSRSLCWRRLERLTSQSGGAPAHASC